MPGSFENSTTFLEVREKQSYESFECKREREREKERKQERKKDRKK